MLFFLLLILNCLRLTWLLKPGYARLMISSTNSLVLFNLQYSLGMDRLSFLLFVLNCLVVDVALEAGIC